MIDQAEPLRLRVRARGAGRFDGGDEGRAAAALDRALEAVRRAASAGEAERRATLRRARDAAAAAGEADLAAALFAAERGGPLPEALGGAAAAAGPSASAPVVEAASEEAEDLVVRIAVDPRRAPRARRAVVRKTLARAFDLRSWEETETGAVASLRAGRRALEALLGATPDVVFEIDQTSRMTVAA